MKNASALQDQETKQNISATTAAKKGSLEETLTSRSLDPETAARLGLRGLDGSIEFPYVKAGVEVYAKTRTHDKRFFIKPDGVTPFFWNFDALVDDTQDTVIITEGEFDALAAIQSGFPCTVSVPNGSQGENGNLPYLETALPYLAKKREIILAVDSDEKGVALMNALAIRLTKARCKWVKYPKGCKDLNDALVKFGEKGVQESIKRAEWVAVDGDYSLLELPPLPEQRKYFCQFHGMDLNIRMGDFSVVTGIPSCGKSTFVNDLLCRLIQKSGIKPAIGSFEQMPQTDHRRALRTWHAGKLEKEMGEEEKVKADNWIDKSFRFIVPNDDDEVTLEWLLERMAAVVVRRGCNVIVIDPWNELDHRRPQDLSITEYVGYAIRELKRFAKKYQVHVMVVAHPAKMKRDKDNKLLRPTLYDISDSAHWYNKADLGIIVHRDKDGTAIEVAKSRYHTEIGKPELYAVTYDFERGRFMVIDDAVFNGKDKGR